MLNFAVQMMVFACSNDEFYIRFAGPTNASALTEAQVEDKTHHFCSTKSIIFDTKSIISDANSSIFNAKSIIFNKNIHYFNAKQVEDGRPVVVTVTEV